MGWSFPNRPGSKVYEYEHACLLATRRHLADADATGRVRITGIALDGEWPDTAVVVDYVDRRGVACKRRFLVWNDHWADYDGSPTRPADFAGLARALFDEDA